MIFYCGGAREFLFFLPDFRNIFSRWLRFRFFMSNDNVDAGVSKNACRVSVIRVMRSRIHFSPYIFIVRVRVCANTYSGQYEFHHTNAPSSRIRFSFFHRVKTLRAVSVNYDPSSKRRLFPNWKKYYDSNRARFAWKIPFFSYRRWISCNLRFRLLREATPVSTYSVLALEVESDFLRMTRSTFLQK